MNYRRKRTSHFSDIEKILNRIEKSKDQLIDVATDLEIDVDQLVKLIDECTSFRIYQLIDHPDRKLVLIDIKND